jgi:UDP-N-acetyl-D-mannosaminuronic acid dehydrogenase
MPRRNVAVIGLGYVGLPLACVLADAGFDAVGIDIDESRIKTINDGRCPIEGEEPGLPQLIRKVVRNGKLLASGDYQDITGAAAIFICLDSPVGLDHCPDLSILISGATEVGRKMIKGALVSIESTLPPGAMGNELIPELERSSGMRAGSDFSVVHCPERVMPGRLLHNMRTLDRVIGGLDPTSLDKALPYYSVITKGRLHTTDLISAEISKTAENAYRDVQIAFANEVALICEQMGADAFEVRRLVNTCPFRDMHVPGSGVGGHCLPKDPWLLVSGAKPGQAKLLPAARMVNEGMPEHLCHLAEEAMLDAERPVKDSLISVMGLAFLRDSDDTRNSPAKEVIDHFLPKTAVVVHDEFVARPYRAPLVRSVQQALGGSDCAIFVTDHTIYKDLDLDEMKELMRTPVVVDGRNLFDSEKVRSKGFVYRGIGKGIK